MDEVERRYADQAPAWLLPRLSAIQNQRQLWAEAARKRAHDHRLELRARGAEDVLEKDDQPAMPGDIYIQGDTYQVEPKAHAAAPAQLAEKPKSWLPTLALAAAMLGGGAGLGYFVSQIVKPPPPAGQPAIDTDSDTITELDFPGE